MAIFTWSCSTDADAEALQDLIAMEDDNQQENDAAESADENENESEEGSEESSSENEDNTTEEDTDGEAEGDSEEDTSGGDTSDDDTSEGETSDEETTDGNDETTSETDSPLVGVWIISGLRIDESVDDDDLNFAQQIVDFLVGEDCDFVIFEFNADGTVQVDNRTNFLRPSATATGLTVPCPEESDMENSAWSLEGDQLTFINDMEEEVTITVTFEGEDTLIIAGGDINAENFTGADAVFTKQ